LIRLPYSDSQGGELPLLLRITDGTVELRRSEFVGPRVTSYASRAVHMLLALGLVMLYIAFRFFQLKFAG
jgi:preprotein translocase subunit SecF